MIKILLFDSCPVVWLGFVQIIKERASVSIKAVSNLQALTDVATSFEPDLLVVTINTSLEQDTLSLIGQCRTICGNVPLVLFDDEHRSSHLTKWITADVAGYLSKRENPEVILQCLDVILTGGKYLSPRAWDIYFGVPCLKKQYRSSALGTNELTVARFLSEGKSTTWIARHLGKKPQTISTVKRRVFDKLEVDNPIALSRILNTVTPSSSI